MTKLKSFLLGTVFALLLLECALRVFGSLQTLPQNSRTGGVPRIITLGNSHTFGSGTTRDLSYPAQLEKLLHENGFLESIVINPARPNETTSSILDELPDLIRKYHPEYAFVMAGEPNRWNLTGYGEYLRRKGLEASREKKWGEILGHVRVVKLVKLLFNETPVSLAGKNVNESEKLFLWLPLLLVDIAQPIPIPPERLNEAIGDWEKNLAKNLNDEKEAFLAWLWSQQSNQKETLKHVDRSLREGKFYYLSWFALKKIPESPEVNAMKARLKTALPRKVDLKIYENWFLKGKIPEKFNAETFYQNAFNIYPYHAHSYFRLIEELNKKKKFVEAALLVGREIEINPFPNNGNHFGFFDNIIEAAEVPAEKKQVSEILERARESFIAKFPEESYRTLPHLFYSDHSEWVRADLREIVKLLRQSGAQVIFQNYPPQRWGKPNRSNADIEIVAKEMGVPLLDTHKVVGSAFQKGTRESFYATQLGPHENHLNEKGYAIVARQMYEYLLPFISPKKLSR